MNSNTHQAACMNASCRYTETYQRHPVAPKCPKCGTSMIVKPGK